MNKIRLSLSLIALSFLFLLSPVVKADSFLVNNATDCDPEVVGFCFAGLSLRGAIHNAKQIPGPHEINFDPSLPETIEVNGDFGPIVIEEPLTINGDNHRLVMTNVAERIFDIQTISTGEFFIKDLELTSGTIGGVSGGCMEIDSNGVVTLQNVTFDTCKTDLHGGGIWHLGGDLVVQESQFLNNQALGGGAIYSLPSGNVLISLESLEFLNNQAISNGGSLARGGAVYIDANTHSPVVNISQVSFVQNTSSNNGDGDAYGGAVYFATLGSPTIAIQGTEFQKNQTSSNLGFSQGGAIRIHSGGGNVMITQTSFNENKAIKNGLDADAGASGGAIRAGGSNGSFEINNSVFTNNTSESKVAGAAGCGALCLNGKDNFIEESVFEGNEALAHGDHAVGGAISYYDQEGSNQLNILKSHFRNNLAYDSNGIGQANGGAISFGSGQDLRISQSSFYNNRALSGPNHGYGAAVHIADPWGTNQSVEIVNTSILLNKSTTGGAFAVMASVPQVSLQHVTFINNEAGLAGAHLWSNADTNLYNSFLGPIAPNSEDISVCNGSKINTHNSLAVEAPISVGCVFSEEKLLSATDVESLFLKPVYEDSALLGYLPTVNSPLYDQGSASELSVDQLDNTRLWGAAPDIGALELNCDEADETYCTKLPPADTDENDQDPSGDANNGGGCGLNQNVQNTKASLWVGVFFMLALFMIKRQLV